jgi:hypothetical protein
VLYESISVRNYRASLNLARTLTEDSRIGKEDLLSLSMYSRRLEINLEEDTSALKRDYSHIPPILSLCKRLRILFIRPEYHVVAGNSNLDIEAVRQNIVSLRHLDLYYLYSGFTSFFVKNLRHLSQLEVFTVHFHPHRNLTDECTDVYLPCMHTLQIIEGYTADFLPWLITWKIPSFRRLSLLGRSDPVDYHSLFDVFGHQITYIQCDQIQGDIAPLLLRCTSLEHLIISNRTLLTSIPILVPSSLRKVSVSMCIGPFIADDFYADFVGADINALSEALDSLFKWRKSSLTCLRLLGIGSSTMQRLRANSNYARTLDQILEKCRSENLRVEYHNGEVVDSNDMGKVGGV